MDKEKMKMSQDQLYKYLMDHDVIILRLSELMGLSKTSVNYNFRHTLNANGNPRYFTVDGIKKLNEALHVFAHELRDCLLHFGTDKMYTNKHGRTYDPGMIEPINHLGKYLNTTALMGRMLGWSKSKKANIFGAPTVKNYGNISEDDVDVLNVEIMSVAGVLENVEVVPDPVAIANSKRGSDSSSI